MKGVRSSAVHFPGLAETTIPETLQTTSLRLGEAFPFLRRRFAAVPDGAIEMSPALQYWVTAPEFFGAVPEGRLTASPSRSQSSLRDSNDIGPWTPQH
jgi:hypothetical protein